MLFITLILACTGGSGKDDTSNGDTDSGDSGMTFAPTAGDYASTYGTYTGTCDPSNNISGARQIDTWTLASADSAYTMSYCDSFGDAVTLDCTRSGMDLSCAGSIVEMSSSGPDGDATAAFDTSMTLTWSSETAFSGDVLGTLDCTGTDTATCTDTAEGWGLTMPCTMGYPLDGALSG